MKKLIIAAVVVLMSAQAFAGAVVSLSVEFGHGDGCADKGICKVTVSLGKAMTAQVNDSNGNLDMSFNQSLISKDIIDYHFANGIFEVPVDYIVSADICKQLGLDRFTIKAGKYKVSNVNGFLTVSFVNKTTLTTLSK
jgi:hypothetical protein